MVALANYKYQDIIHRCFRCGYCKFPADWSDVTNCPAYGRFRLESFSSGGRLWLIRAWVNGEIQWTPHLAKIVYACVACNNCVEKCPLPFHDDIVHMINAAKSEMVELGLLPKEVKTYLHNVQQHGNPYGLPAKRRSAWMESLNLEPFQGQEYLYYVGCEGSYDTRAQLAARAVAAQLKAAGVAFGVLGNAETADGNDVEMLGEEGLAELVATRNIATFHQHGVRKIVVLSPHSFNAMKHMYPRFGGNFEVYHYTQIQPRLLGGKKIQCALSGTSRVTYHDPCLLGRWNREYNAPRKLLAAIDGVELVEMPRNKKSALCCGGGAGNYLTDFLGGSAESPARMRIREAHATGAAVLAVACPNCLTMLEDAVKVEGLEGQLAVRDIAELMGPAEGA